MASSASLFIEALSNLYIVVTYLCIKGWWSLVNKVVHAAYYLADRTHIGYGPTNERGADHASSHDESRSGTAKRMKIADRKECAKRP